MPSDAQATAAHAAVLVLMLFTKPGTAEPTPDLTDAGAADVALLLVIPRHRCRPCGAPALVVGQAHAPIGSCAPSRTHATAPSATVASPEPPTVARGPSAVVSGPPSAVPSGDALSSTALRAASIAARCCGGDFACKRHRERYERSVDRAAEREARNGDGL